MRVIRFSKMQALGNDFVVLDGVREAMQLDAGQRRRLADRRLGVGCDQLLVLDPPPDAQSDFGYRIYNADGGEAGQCGNGARALALFAARGHGASGPIRIATASTRLVAEVLGPERVRITQAPPDLAPAAVPLRRRERADLYRFTLPDGRQVEAAAVGLGNPHAVIAVDAVDRAPVAEVGAALTGHADFPEGVNVGFVEVVEPSRLRLRVYERGVGETPACGSGACAAAVAARLWGRGAPAMRVQLPGGELEVAWEGEGAPIIFAGPAQFVFDGEIEL